MLFFKLIRMKCPQAILTARSSRTGILALAFAFLVLRAAADTNSADPKRYLDDVKTLASPAMEGRGAGTKGIERAADLIEQRYRTIGLQPAGSEFLFSALHGDYRGEIKRGKSPAGGGRQIQAGIETESGFCPLQLFRVG